MLQEVIKCAIAMERCRHFFKELPRFIQVNKRTMQVCEEQILYIITYMDSYCNKLIIGFPWVCCLSHYSVSPTSIQFKRFPCLLHTGPSLPNLLLSSFYKPSHSLISETRFIFFKLSYLLRLIH